MRRYKNLEGNSGVTAYEITGDAIKVRFSSGDVYLYTYASAERSNIEHMKILAAAGRGLSTFIAQRVQQGYADKLR